MDGIPGEASEDLYRPQFADWSNRSMLYPLATWVNGLAFKNIQFSPSGEPVIKIAEIKGGISSQTKFTEQSFDDSVHVENGDLLFAWSGQPETSIDAYRWKGPEGWLNQHIFKVTPSTDVDDEFFYYLLKYLRPTFVAIARNKQTTGLGHVTRRDLENLEVALPSLSEQRAIGDILTALDNKIELNRRMTETLGKMARDLYQSWFVNFDPVRAKMDGWWEPGESLPGLPAELYDRFPDRLVPSGLGDIPDGWRVATLGDCMDLAYGKALKASTRNPGSIPVFGSNGQVGWHDQSLVAGPGVVVGRKGNPGTVSWCQSDFFPIDTTFYVVPKLGQLGAHFMFYALAWQDLPALAADSAVPGLNRNLVSMNLQLVPSGGVGEHFERFCRTILEKCDHLDKESWSLAAQRDSLLPELVSGRIKAGDLEG